MNEENGPREPADQTGNPQRNQNAPRDIQLLGIGAAARRCSYPQRERVGGIRGNRGNAGKQKGRKSNKAPAPGHGIHAASEGAGNKQKDRTLRVQAEVVSRFQSDCCQETTIALRRRSSCGIRACGRCRRESTRVTCSKSTRGIQRSTKDFSLASA